MPEAWLEANIILLYKTGPTHNPTNCRPMALFNTLYKVVAIHAAKQLYEFSHFYGLVHKSQNKGLPNHRCSDHIFGFLSKFQNCPASYSLYIDFKRLLIVSHINRCSPPLNTPTPHP